MALHMGLISFALVLLAALLHGATADNYTVLGNQGWTIPNSPDAYRNWAAKEEFEVGDILIFNFPTGRHDVAEVTEAAFNSCSATKPLYSQKNAPANINLTSNGNHYFICTIPGHCAAGQKLAISVGTKSGAATPPSGSAAPPGTPGATGTGPSGSTAPSSAQSIAVSSFSIAAFMSIALAFLY